mmetsp:Transcript_4435/g.10717  ORF Transcript_4435/g.10717 Transcript_4435/m.10717 type:complete len:423 (+) Transcript_4435:43-1311(+)
MPPVPEKDRAASSIPPTALPLPTRTVHNCHPPLPRSREGVGGGDRMMPPELPSVVVLLLLLLGLLEPLHEGLHVLHEDVAALGGAALAVPVVDRVLRDDVAVVEEADDVRKQLQLLAVLVAADLDLDHEGRLEPSRVGHRPDELLPGLDLLQHHELHLLLVLPGEVQRFHEGPPDHLEDRSVRQAGRFLLLLHEPDNVGNGMLLHNGGEQLLLHLLHPLLGKQGLAVIDNGLQPRVLEVLVEPLGRPLLRGEELDEPLLDLALLQERDQLLQGALREVLPQELGEERGNGSLGDHAVVLQGLEDLLREDAELVREDHRGRHRDLLLPDRIKELERLEELARRVLQALDEEGAPPDELLEGGDERHDFLSGRILLQEVERQLGFVLLKGSARSHAAPGIQHLKQGFPIPREIERGRFENLAAS